MPYDAVLTYLKAYREHEGATRRATDLMAKVRAAAEATKDWQTRRAATVTLQSDHNKAGGEIAALPLATEVEGALAGWSRR